MIRLCAETEKLLYQPPRPIRYDPGSRPQLETVIRDMGYQPMHSDHGLVAHATKAMRWTRQNVQHPHLIGPTPPNRAFTEERLIASKIGWCNEQARVFIALCQVMEIPARLCFLFHSNARCGHTAAEVFLDGKWTFHDVTFGIEILAEARELRGDLRHLAHEAYREPLRQYYEGIQPFVENCVGWRKSDRPDIDRGGDLLDSIGICNYLIEGVEET